MTRVFIALALLVGGCELAGRVADADGQVYQCALADGTTVEKCYYADSADELADRLEAKSCQLTDRWWPAITNALGRGCRYACPPPGPGCNATGGCYCPSSSSVPLTSWHAPTDGCNTWWAKPAVFCSSGRVLEMRDGCHWRCELEVLRQ